MEKLYRSNLNHNLTYNIDARLSVPTCALFMLSDDIELHAQVPAEVSPGASERDRAAALLDLPELRVQGDRIHRSHGVPKRKGKLSIGPRFLGTRDERRALCDLSENRSASFFFFLPYFWKKGRTPDRLSR